WDVFKGNFGKIVKVNLLILLFCIPSIIVLFVGTKYRDNLGILGPYNLGTAMGYPCPGPLIGVAEWNIVMSELFFVRYAVFQYDYSGSWYFRRHVRYS
ncbi:MAG: hypothetical protein IJD33_01720, partial [Clostridia bacterium]|nr:hypothetical protein [Clostridia bacterium]